LTRTLLRSLLDPHMRIIAGTHRSRLLQAPKGVSTRPTSDRVREAIFSILGSRSPFLGGRVLDLYAGTGALGLEALSRGACAATFVECSRSALQALRANVAALGVTDRTRIVTSVVERSAEALAVDAPFDLILADPPYALVKSGEVAGTLADLVRRAWLAGGGHVVLEHGKEDASPPIEGLFLSEVRRYGDTAVAFYRGAAIFDAAHLSTSANDD